MTTEVAESATASTGIAAAAVARGDDALVVLGGDGLLHHVLPAVVSTGLPVGIVPGGTGNDAATAFGLPGEWSAAADAVADALTRHSESSSGTTAIDVGVAIERSGRTTPFATVLCWGLDAAVSELVARLPWPTGPRRYDVAIAVEAVALRHRRITITLDAQQPTTSAALLVAVGNGGWYGGGKRMVPQAAIDDGRLGVTVVGRVTRRALARLAPTLPTAGHVDHPAVTLSDARLVRLSARATVSAWADGERVGPLPLTVTTRAGALTVLRPAWCRPPEPLRLGHAPGGLSGSGARA